MKGIRSKCFAVLSLGILLVGFALNYIRVQRREERSLIILCGHLIQPDVRARESAVYALSRERPNIDCKLARLLTSKETVTRLAWQNLPTSIRRRFPEPFSAAYKRKLGVTAVGMLGPPLSPQIEAALRDSCWETNVFIRRRAALILGYLGESTAMTIKAIENVQTTEIFNKRERLENTGFHLVPSSVEDLGRSLRAPFPEARYQAANRLSDFGTNSLVAVPALIQSLGDTNEMVVIASARALGRIGTGAEAAIPRLMELSTREGVLGQSATRALYEIRGEHSGR